MAVGFGSGSTPEEFGLFGLRETEEDERHARFDEDLFVRLADGSEFLLVAIHEFDQEIARTRNNPRLMALLEDRARQTATVPLDEVKRRLGL